MILHLRYTTREGGGLLHKRAVDQVKEEAMARPLRIEYPGEFYHVTSRGNEQKDVLESIKIRVLVRPVNGKNLSPIRGMPGRLTRDPSPKYGLSTHFFMLSHTLGDLKR